VRANKCGSPARKQAPVVSWAEASSSEGCAAKQSRAGALQVLAELTAAEAAKAGAVAGAQLLYAQAAARLRTMQASADQRVRRAARAPSPFWPRGCPPCPRARPAPARRRARALWRALAACRRLQTGLLRRRGASRSTPHPTPNQLKASPNALRAARGAQDSLAEGMHLIDFEQLKMENAALREKIEERGDEVARLRRKTHATVQASETARRPARRPGSVSHVPQSWLWRLHQAWLLVRAVARMRCKLFVCLCVAWCLSKGWPHRIVCALKGTMPAVTTARSPGILSSCPHADALTGGCHNGAALCSPPGDASCKEPQHLVTALTGQVGAPDTAPLTSSWEAEAAASEVC